MLKEGDIPILNQIIKSLEESFNRMEEAQRKKDPEKFNEAKKLLLQTQKRLSEKI